MVILDLKGHLKIPYFVTNWELEAPQILWDSKCDTITSPRRLVNTFIHQMITDLLKKRQTYKGGDQL
jgi:hypothetical protein